MTQGLEKVDSTLTDDSEGGPDLSGEVIADVAGTAGDRSRARKWDRITAIS